MSAIGRAWNAAWFGPVLDLRVWLMGRALMLMLALDTWLLMIERGGRYGAGGFNVAHFAWLDAVGPAPTAGLYVGLVLTCGVLAMLTALGALGRWGVIAVTVAYTYAWAMSQLDSYQHHVFISWALLCLCCFPALGTREVWAERRCVCAWGYRLLAAVTALLYLFTGISKTEPQWLSGGVLKRINGQERVLEPIRDALLGLGLGEESFWSLGGHSVVVAQWVITALWLSVLVWGEGGGRWVRVGRMVGVLTAAAFHVGAEVMGLRIGWFSWYMLALTLIAFAPAAWLRAAAAGLDRVTSKILGALPPAGGTPNRLVWAGLCLGTGACFVAVGRELDLPGTPTAGLLWAAILMVSAAVAAARGKSLRTWAIAGAVTVTLLGVSIDSGRVRYDFYRFVGGDATRRMELDAALLAYGRANTYAPEGEGRWKKLETVRAKLRNQR
ncbi:MAG: HTTM domain-containing protein [Myxococcota bacterium]|nr:HTTM domain-containing protein [Myxococcota bacterium]